MHYDINKIYQRLRIKHDSVIYSNATTYRTHVAWLLHLELIAMAREECE